MTTNTKHYTMSTTYTSMKSVKSENLVAPAPPKQVKDRSGQYPYKKTFLQYNYGTANKPKLDTPMFEMQRVRASVRCNTYPPNKEQWKINFTLADEKDVRGCEEMDKSIAKIIERYRAAYRQTDFTADRPSGMIKTHFYVRNEDTGERIEGKDPLMSLKLNDYSKFYVVVPQYNDDGSVCVDKNDDPVVDERPVDYKTLVDTTFECGVMVNFRHLYSNGTMPKPQIFCKACWIFSKPTQAKVIEGCKTQVVRDFLQSATREEIDNIARSVKSEASIPDGNDGTLTTPATDDEQWVPQASQTLDMSAYEAHADL